MYSECLVWLVAMLMKKKSCSSVTLLFLLIAAPAETSAGDHRVSCQEQPIKAVVGGELIIECQVSPTLDLSARTVDVKRTDLEPVSGPGYVHVCRRQHDSPDDQMPQYSNRTFLLHEDLSRGIMTLRIFPVQLSDHGRYRVNIPRLNFSFVDVIVVNEDQQNQTETEDSSTTGPPVEDDHDAAKMELLRNVGIGIFSVCAVAAAVFILVKRGQIQICKKTRGRIMTGQEAETVPNQLELQDLRTRTTEEDEDPHSAAENGALMVGDDLNRNP